MKCVLSKNSTAPHSVYSTQMAKGSASCMHSFSHLASFLNTDVVFKVLLFSRFCVPRFLYKLYLLYKIYTFQRIMIFLNCISIVLICTFVRTCTAVEIYLFATSPSPCAPPPHTVSQITCKEAIGARNPRILCTRAIVEEYIPPKTLSKTLSITLNIHFSTHPSV